MATKIKIPPKRTLEKLHEVGKSFADIGRGFDVSRTTVKNWFKEYGLYSPPGRRAVETPTLEKLDELISGGMSNDGLAGHFQVHVTTVSLWLRTYGLLSKKARAQFRRMAEKVGKPATVKPEFNMPVAGYVVPQLGIMIEHQQQARML
ncbi:MAG: hypothetical protein KAR42_15515 [candidate division Zixibacteria bacterium]|nr:hypothetical protein [candidate division Zixibacteria bacterium]